MMIKTGLKGKIRMNGFNNHKKKFLHKTVFASSSPAKAM